MEQRKVKIMTFKKSGKYYAEEIVSIPDGVNTYDVPAYICTLSIDLSFSILILPEGDCDVVPHLITPENRLTDINTNHEGV